MTKFLLSLSFIIFMSSAFAQKNQKFGLGVLLGSPTALSGKFFLGGNQAADAALSFSDKHIMLLGDYLKHFPGTFGRQNAFVSRLNPYVGIGPVFAFRTGSNNKGNSHFLDEEDDFAFGGRIPLGVEWIAPEAPIGVSLEVAPGMLIVPGTEGFLQAGLAIRYYF